MIQIKLFFTVKIVRHWNTLPIPVAQKNYGFCNPGSVQSQVAWGFKQPGLGEGALAQGREVSTRCS